MNLVGRRIAELSGMHMPKGYESPDGDLSIDQIATKIAVLQDQEYPESDHALLGKITTFDFATKVFGDIHFRA